MEQLGHIHSGQFPVFVHRIGSYDELRSVTPPSRHSVILLAGDAKGISTDIISEAADHLLAAGLSYVCTWGPDCERVHDIFDQSYVGDGTTEPMSEFMSTWHSAESFEEAVEFFAVTAWPMDDTIEHLSYLAILVGFVRTEVMFTEAVRPYLIQTA
ncbi:MAG: hypothetical protein WAW39_04775 [Prosthecobacter sp.]|uniref:DUF7684 family protein n=1 Tax=Prosthecobacter sp. TaxID=1965333 RepID=UPI003BAE95D8